jgi:hypothetical protein
MNTTTETTEMNDVILSAIVRLRKDYPAFTEAEATAIRKALWSAWYIAYDADKANR